jgi:hypothetical protein
MNQIHLSYRFLKIHSVMLELYGLCGATRPLGMTEILPTMKANYVMNRYRHCLIIQRWYLSFSA